MLDPVVTDLPEASIHCQQLGPVSSSDHVAVLSQVELQTAREDATPRTIWLWDKADWPSMKRDIENTDWEALLVGDADATARALTTRLLALQQSICRGQTCCLGEVQTPPDTQKQDTAPGSMQEDVIHLQMGKKSAKGRQKAKAQWFRCWKQDLVETSERTTRSLSTRGSPSTHQTRRIHRHEHHRQGHAPC
ncbi:hypothetical protein E2C01_062189 [Portunus trituberculatus]|uniref:Uncharacterized protein n=1 Tax=Portunus trituberculatus TaxID=210409 RepID=A0A5B7H791_PORTR|nr:hypothetical protein [Portunus trituberculatus]